MPRNASGNYTLPLPSVVTGTVIESLWANTTMNDLASSITDSLDRYGRGGMVAPFRMVDGTVSVPAISFTGETNTGLYRPSAGVVSVSVLGTEMQTWTTAGTTVAGAINVLGEINLTDGLEVGGGITVSGNTSRFIDGKQVLITSSANGSLAPFVTRTFGTNVTPSLQVLGNNGNASSAVLGRFSADASPAILYLNKSRNTTVGSHTILQTSDGMGAISFGGSDGVNIVDAARIAAFVDGAPAVDSMTSRLSFWINTGVVSPVERMRLTPTGLGVGAAVVPATVLHVKGNGNIFRIEGTTARGSGSTYMEFFDPTGRKGYFGYGSSTDTLFVVNEMNSPMVFYTNALERMQIAADGKVAIATTPTIGQFDVQSSGAGIISKTTSENGTVAALGVWNLNPNGMQWYVTCNGSLTDMHTPRGSLFFYVGGTQRAFISTTQLAGADKVAALSGANSAALVGGPAPLVQLFLNGVADWRMLVDSAASLNFDFGGGNIRARLTNTGVWIVGTNAPFAGYQNINSQSLEGAAGYGVLNHSNLVANGTAYLLFGYAGGGIGSITQATTGSVAYNTTSDARLKTAVEDMADQGAVIDAIRPRTFEWLADPGPRYQGFVAQELYEVVPEAVTQVPIPDKDDVVWSVDFSKLVPVLVREIQSLRARVAALEV